MRELKPIRGFLCCLRRLLIRYVSTKQKAIYTKQKVDSNELIITSFTIDLMKCYGFERRGEWVEWMKLRRDFLFDLRDRGWRGGRRKG